jgi:hypothetical protein
MSHKGKEPGPWAPAPGSEESHGEAGDGRKSSPPASSAQILPLIGGRAWRRRRGLESLRDLADRFARTHYRREPGLLAALPEDRREGA